MSYLLQTGGKKAGTDPKKAADAAMQVRLTQQREDCSVCVALNFRSLVTIMQLQPVEKWCLWWQLITLVIFIKPPAKAKTLPAASDLTTRATLASPKALPFSGWLRGFPSAIRHSTNRFSYKCGNPQNQAETAQTRDRIMIVKMEDGR
jgi:hypothetical protein